MASGEMEAIDFIKYRGSRSLLETLLKFPKRTFTINELSKEAGVPFASTWRLVKKWEPAGMIEMGKVGKSITVKIRESPYLKSITKMLKISVSPQAFTADKLRAVFARERKVKEAYLFGSVARGEEKLTSDIDTAVLCEEGFDPNKLVFDIYSRYGTKLIPLTFKTEEQLKSFIKDKKVVKLK
jgi:predicted nucleotidyltransferase